MRDEVAKVLMRLVSKIEKKGAAHDARLLQVQASQEAPLGTSAASRAAGRGESRRDAVWAGKR